MNRGAFFWGAILILFGGLLLLNNLGLLGDVNIWNLIWPGFLILLGIRILAEPLFFRGKVAYVAIPLEGANQARLKLGHGAGRLQLGAGASAANLVEGDFGGGVKQKVNRSGETLSVSLDMPPQFFPGVWFPGALDWQVRLNPAARLELDIQTGAGEYQLDLTDLQVRELTLQTGASSTHLTLPARSGRMHATVKAGAASVNVRIPEGVAARIQASVGLASVSVDPARFPRQGDYYQSEDYMTAEHAVDLHIETGLGAVDVR